MSTPTFFRNLVIVPLGTIDRVALNRQNGEMVWQKSANKSGRWDRHPDAVVWNNKVFLIDNTYPIKGEITCHDVSSGDLLWSYRTPKGMNQNVKYGRRQINAPVIKNGRLYFSDYQGIVYCLNPANGTLLWRTDLNVLLNRKKGFFMSGGERNYFKRDAYEYLQSPLVGERYLFAFSSSGHLVCLNLEDGSKNWIVNFKVGHSTDAKMLGMIGKRLFVVYAPYKKGVSPSSHNLFAFDTATGRKLWKSSRLPGTYSFGLQRYKGNLVLTGGNALFGSNYNLSFLTRLNIRNGRRISLKRLWFDVRTPVRIIDGRRYYIRYQFHRGRSWAYHTFSTVLYCDNAISGRNLWKTVLISKSNDWYRTGTLPKSRVMHLVIHDGKAFVTIREKLWCIDLGKRGLQMPR